MKELDNANEEESTYLDFDDTLKKKESNQTNKFDGYDIDISKVSNDDLLSPTPKFIKILKSIRFDKIFNGILTLLTFILLTALVSIACFQSKYEINEVSGQSMKPTFNAEATQKIDPLNDMAVYCKQQTYERGDVIIYNHNNSLVIKRIIALAGDRIKIDMDFNDFTYKVFLNGEILNEPYLDSKYSDMYDEYILFRKIRYNSEWKSHFEDGYLVIPEGYFFYMGDNRTNSLDCTTYGPQKYNENIMGKVVYKYPKSYENDKIDLFFLKMKIFYIDLFGELKENF